MSHRSFPGLGSRELVIYALMWLAIAVIHALVLYFGYSLSVNIAITEAVVLNGWFAVLGIGIWYMARFSDLQKSTKIELLITHISAVTLLVLLWLVPAMSLLRLLFHSNGMYAEFLAGSITIRVITGVGLYAAITTIVYLKGNLDQLRAQQIREDELQSLLREAELTMLRFQVNPHFLFNSLNSVSALIVSKPDEAYRMIVKLSDFMRYSLDSSGAVMRTLQDELKHCKQYIDIEVIRFGERLKVDFAVDPGLLTAPVPAMLLQPLVENSVKHGLNSLLEGISVGITIRQESQMLLISIVNPIDDNGSPETPGTGTGLKNIKDRLRNIYGRPDLLAVVQRSGLFTVTIKLPMHD